MTAPSPPHPTRYAIQKARGKGWKTLEVGEELPHAKARFETMIGVNPRAYFRLIQLDYNAEADYEGMEFNWTLIELYDPTQKSTRRPPPPRVVTSTAGGARGARPPKTPNGKERVPLPLRFYLAVVLIGLLVGGLAYLRYAAPGR